MREKEKGKLKMKNSNVYKDPSEVKWVDGTVYDILKNPIYKGQRKYKVHSNKDKSGKDLRIMSRSSAGRRVPSPADSITRLPP